MGYAWDSFSHAKGAFNVLWRSLSHINSTNRMVKTTGFSGHDKVSLPDRLWAEPAREENCLDLIQLELEGYQVLVTLIPETLVNWRQKGNESGLSDTMTEIVSQRLGNITSLKSCVGEYKNVVTTALDSISSIKNAAENLLKSDTHTDFRALKGSIGDHITAINQSASVLSRHLESYSAYKMSKMYLAENLLNTSIRDRVRRRMESIIFKIDLDAMLKLQTETEAVKSLVHKWFISSFDSFTKSINYFGNDVVFNMIRNLNLWRKPTVDFRTPDVIKYTYGSSENWRMWPTTTYIVNLTTLAVSQKIAFILDGYMFGINDALYEVKHTLLGTKEEVMSAFDALWHELEAYRQEGQINDRFIRYIPLSNNSVQPNMAQFNLTMAGPHLKKYQHGLTLIPTWISNYIHYKL